MCDLALRGLLGSAATERKYLDLVSFGSGIEAKAKSEL